MDLVTFAIFAEELHVQNVASGHPETPNILIADCFKDLSRSDSGGILKQTGHGVIMNLVPKQDKRP